MRSRYLLPIALVLVLLATVATRAGADTIHFKNRSVLNNVAVLTAGTGWCVAFAVFTWVYWPILTRPRIGGKD